MTADGIIYIWSLKKVLMSADQLCLSRMQIHVILSIVHPNEHGEVDAEYFLRLACTVIPWMFDTRRFMEKAGMIVEEKADYPDSENSDDEPRDSLSRRQRKRRAAKAATRA